MYTNSIKIYNYSGEESPFKRSHSPAFSDKPVKKLKSYLLKRRIYKMRFLHQSIINASLKNVKSELFSTFNQFCFSLSLNSSIEHLNLSGVVLNSLFVIRLMKAIENHPNLTKIELSNMNLSTLCYRYICSSLGQNKSIKSIQLINNILENETFRDITELFLENKTIEEINLNFSSIQEDGIKMFFKLFSKNTPLKNIKLANVGLNAMVSKVLSYCLNRKHSLECLDLSHNGLGDKELSLMISNIPKKIKKKKKKIKSIILDGNKINGQKALGCLLFLIERTEDLKILSLCKNKLQGNDLVLLDKIVNGLEKLDLSRNKLNENFPNNIDMFIHIQIINFSFNKLQGQPIIIISEALEKANWIELNISSCNIIDEDFIVIMKALIKNTKLKILNVSNNEISNNGLEILPKLLEKTKINELNLSNNYFDEKSLFCLFNPKFLNLKKIILNDFPQLDYTKSIIKEVKEISLKNVESLSIIRSFTFFKSVIVNLQTAESLTELILAGSSLLLASSLIQDLSLFIKSTKTLKILNLCGLNLGALTKSDRLIISNSLSENTSINELDLSRNKLGDHINSFLNSLKGCSNLIILNLSNNYIPNKKGEDLANFLKHKENLKSLDISHNLITYTTFEKIATVLGEHKNLECLKIGCMRLDIYCLFALGPALSKNKSLKTLDLSQIVFEEESILSAYKKRRKLESLNVTNLELEEFEYSILSTIFAEHSQNITSLNLFGCLFSNSMKKSLITNIKNLIFLKYLNISGTSLNDDDIIDLIYSLDNIKNLEEFVLRNMRISHRFILALRLYLEKTISLKKLDMSDNNIRPNFLKDLEETLASHKFIEEISLNNCQLTDESIIYIEQIILKNISLKYINLEKNFFTSKKIGTIIGNNKKIPFNSLNFNNSNFFKSIIEIKQINILEINFSKSIYFKDESITYFQSFLQIILSETSPLKVLILDENNLNDTILSQIGISLSKNINLFNLSLSKNKFTSVGFEPFLFGLQKNKTLHFLSLADNFVNKPLEINTLKIFQETFLLHNKTLEIVDISNFNLEKNANNVFKHIFLSNSNIAFFNNGWKNINSSCGILIINSIEKKYRDLQIRKIIYPKLKIFNFSQCNLDDDFCLYFSENILKFEFVEVLIFNGNPKITLIGLKYIYVNMIYFRSKLSLTNVFFETIDYKLPLNNGLAASLSEWGHYANETQKRKRFWQKICASVFSKMVTVNNKFQYSESFQDFSRKFKQIWIWLFFLLNFFCYIILSISLPINSVSVCGEAHSSYSHYVYSIYIAITVIMEIIFWLYYKYHIKDYSESSKRLKKEIFINDILFILSSIMAKYDLYLDVSFLTLSYSCEYYKTFIGSLVVLGVKVFVKSEIFITCMIKLIISICKKNELSTLNLIAKLSMIQDYYLIGDIMDRYVPGNSKKIKSVCCKKLNRSINISFALFIAYLKLIIEDLPQVIIQIIYVFFVAKYGKSGKSSSNWIVLVNISKNLVSLLASCYGSASVRPSYLVQSDFDEALKFDKTIQLEHAQSIRRKTNLLFQSLEKNKNSVILNVNDFSNIKEGIEYKKIISPIKEFDKETITIAEEDLLHEKDLNLRDHEIFTPL